MPLAVPQNVKMELPYDPAIPLLSIYSREMKMYVHTKTYTRMFIAALLIIAKKYNQPKCLSTDKWMNKLWVLFGPIKEGSSDMCYSMDEP